MQRTALNIFLFSALLVSSLAGCDSGGEPEAEGFELPSAPGSEIPRATDGDDNPASTSPEFGQDGDDDSNSGSNSGPPSGGQGAIGEGNNGDPTGGVEADPGLSCLELYDNVAVCYETYYGCVSACEDQACADTCEETYWGCYDGTVEQGSQLGQDQFTDLRVCEETHYQGCYDQGETLYVDCADSCANETCTKACADEANAALMQCMVDVCGLVYQVCGVQVLEDEEAGSGGGADQNGGEVGEQATVCASLYDCEDACDGDQSCGQACYDAADQAAQAQWSELIGCGIQHCNNQVEDAQSYKACLQQQCSDVYASCFGGSPSNNGGNGGNGGGAGDSGTCGTGYVCIQGCYATATNEASFYACIDVCYAAMDDTAMELLDALGDCSNVQCAEVPGGIENYYQCQQDFCSGQYNACMNQAGGNGGNGDGWNDPGAGSGNQTCAEIYDGVFEVCIPGYETCASSCSNDACVQGCKDDIETCISNEQSSAPQPESDAFEAVTQCRASNYQTCYDSSNTVWQGCMANCMPGDSSCESACADSANQNYEDCYVPLCYSEYQTCGIL